MNRAEIEKAVEPLIRRSLRELEYTPEHVTDADFDKHSDGTFRPDVRRVSLILSMAQSLLGRDASGEGLEVGSAFGYLLFSAAVLLPQIRWTGLDFPGRTYRHREAYEKAYREYKCRFVAADLCKAPLPFANGQFSVVTFSEVLEHLPVEHVSFVFSELARVTRPGGILIVTSPNQASLENRIKLLKGKSILDMPNRIDSLGGVFGHIRLYTPREIESTLSSMGFGLERSEIETNISGFRGTAKSLRRRVYRLYERLEGGLGVLRRFGDTYYLAFRKEARGSGRIA